ncbi:MAG TPA: hypothetical protein VNA04_16005 [Thermoanaerobaculia bacterium]|nr:hypothetical protein [Thermoanaerobaculia bacterium]
MSDPRLVLLALLLLVSSGCGMVAGPARTTLPAPQPPPFSDRVWRVVEARDVPPGTLYVFLSDNTLLVTPANGSEPLLGRWHHAGGGLVVIEAGYRFPADILELGPERFAIRLHRPGGAADIRMVPARD